jgi:hypothetical protein
MYADGFDENSENPEFTYQILAIKEYEKLLLKKKFLQQTEIVFPNDAISNTTTS